MRYPHAGASARLPFGMRIASDSADNVHPTAPMPVTNQALSGGYQLLNYRIDRQISRGGFSIVYRAFDETGVPVAIKEYLPSSLVLRTEGDIVRATSAENMASFRYGMKCFFEEGRALAKINAPERRARAEFLPRQRDRVHGDALRARAHAAAADPDAPGPDVASASCATSSCTC